MPRFFTHNQSQHLKITHQVLLGMAVIVVGLGAYTRLKHAGLGCPDWPKCYQNWLVHPNITAPALSQEATMKAWIEMIHRYIAGLLGLGVLALRQQYHQKKAPCTRLNITLGIIVLQAVFGMWTVTWRLHPIAVMPHLIGGITITTLLYLDYFKKFKNTTPIFFADQIQPKLKILWSLCVIQIITGGWTSANYAALVCPDFPTCQGHWVTSMDHIIQGFSLPIGHLTYEGGVLSGEARIAIHIVHRIGALLCTLMLLHTCYAVFSNSHKLNSLYLFRFNCIVSTFSLQIALGVSNVIWKLPIITAVGHNLMALALIIQLTQVITQEKLQNSVTHHVIYPA